MLIPVPGCFPSLLPAPVGWEGGFPLPHGSAAAAPFFLGRPHRAVGLQGEAQRDTLSPQEAAEELGCFPVLALLLAAASLGGCSPQAPTGAISPRMSLVPALGTGVLGSSSPGVLLPGSCPAPFPSGLPFPYPSLLPPSPNQAVRTGRSTQPRFAGKGRARCLFSLLLLFYRPFPEHRFRLPPLPSLRLGHPEPFASISHAAPAGRCSA